MKPKKTKRIAVTLEVETTANTREVRAYFLTCGSYIGEHRDEGMDVIQVQTNVIKDQKTRAR